MPAAPKPAHNWTQWRGDKVLICATPHRNALNQLGAGYPAPRRQLVQAGNRNICHRIVNIAEHRTGLIPNGSKCMNMLSFEDVACRCGGRATAAPESAVSATDVRNRPGPWTRQRQIRRS